MSATRTLLRQTLPWVASGASGMYVLRRAYQLSMAEPTAETMAQFVLRRGDLLVMLVGSPTVWYIARHPQQLRDGVRASASAAENSFHQLRQAFTVATLAVELLRRRLQAGNTADMLPLLTTLRRVLGNGRSTLNDLEQAYYSDGDVIIMTARGTEGTNGTQT